MADMGSLYSAMKKYWDSIPASKAVSHTTEHVKNLGTMLSPSSDSKSRKEAAAKWADSVIEGAAGMGPSDIGVGGLAAYTMKSGRYVPDYLVAMLQNPREVPNALSLKTQDSAKEMLKRELPDGGKIRMTDIGELNGILNGNDRIGVSFEGSPGISAQDITGNRPIVAYGRNDMVSASRVFPDNSVVSRGQGPNEVKIDPKVKPEDVKYGIAGEGLFSLGDLYELFRANVP